MQRTVASGKRSLRKATEVRLAAVMDTAFEKYENDCDYCSPRTLPELVAPSIELGCLYELMKFALY